MKKIFLLAIGVLCCMYSAAQTPIPDGIDKNGLQDYVICEYVKEYCETYSRTHVGDDIKEYKEKIKAELDKNKIESPVSHDKLSDLLKNKWSATKTNIVDVLLKNNTERVEDILNIEKCSNELSLKKKQGELKEELCAYINNKIKEKPIVDEEDKLKQENDKLKQENDELKQEYVKLKQENDKTRPTWLWLIIAFIVGLIVGFIYRYFSQSEKIDENDSQKEKKNNNDSYHNVKPSPKDKRIKDIENENQKQHNQIIELTTTIQKLEQQLNSTKGKVEPLPTHKPVPIVKKEEPQKPPETFKYLKTATKGVFKKSFDTNGGCYFKMFHIAGDKAQFEFLGENEAYCIANKDAIFDDVCDIHGVFEAKHIKNEIPGIVQNIGDDQWKVVTKAQIKFEE